MRARLAPLFMCGFLVAGPALAGGEPPEQPRPAAALQASDEVPPPAPPDAKPPAAKDVWSWVPWHGLLIGGGVGFGFGFAAATMIGADLESSLSVGALYGSLGALLLGGVQFLAILILENMEPSVARQRPEAAPPPLLLVPSISVGETTALGLTVRF